MPKIGQKVGFVIKNSDLRSRAQKPSSGRFSPATETGRLLSVSHYHQRHGVHPTPIQLEAVRQCIELVTAGRGWVEIDGAWKEVTPGDLLWHIPGDFTIGRSDFQNPYRCLAICFLDGKTATRRAPRYSRWEDLDEVRLFTHQVVHLHADDVFDSEVLLRYILSRVHFQAELYRRIQRERGLPPELQQVLEMVNRRYAEPLRLEELARGAGWSVPHLHDRFKERLGLSPHQALIRRRMQVARELLASTNDPIKSVAARCGFPTASAFCVQFKKATRHSPKDYRESQLFGGRRDLTR
jgi:AraC-like DNA-binding protein